MSGNTSWIEPESIYMRLPHSSLNKEQEKMVEDKILWRRYPKNGGLTDDEKPD